MILIVGNLDASALTLLRSRHRVFKMTITSTYESEVYVDEVEGVSMEIADLLRFASEVDGLLMGCRLGDFYELNQVSDCPNGGCEQGCTFINVFSEMVSDGHPRGDVGALRWHSRRDEEGTPSDEGVGGGGDDTEESSE